MYDSVEIPTDVISQIVNAVPKNEETERCFLFYGTTDGIGVYIAEAHEVPNRHAEPKGNFLISTADGPTTGNDLVGYMHTHPRGRMRVPSDLDFEVAVKMHPLIGIVMYAPNRRVTIYDAHGVISQAKWRA